MIVFTEAVCASLFTHHISKTVDQNAVHVIVKDTPGVKEITSIVKIHF